MDAVESRFGSEVYLSEHRVDLYWNVDLRAAFGMVDHPEQHIDCGQSSDDVREIADLLGREGQEPLSLWHDLDHLAGVLRMLAYLDLPDGPESGRA